MKKEVIGKCPICGHDLYVTKLSCGCCHSEITGEFTLSKFNYLSYEQLRFVEIFIKNGGNIKMIERELKISYPTVKKLLDEVTQALGYNKVTIEEEILPTRKEILDSLKNEDISFAEAEELLNKIK